MSSSSPRRVILVGCGAVARQFYVPALRALQNAGTVRVSAIVDPVVNARDAIARAFPKAGQAASLEQTTAPAGTLAIIASPPGFHAVQTIAAFERGWHVLCEKPMASSASEAAEMVAAAQRHQRLLAVGLYKRFFPASQYLRALCRDWLLGPLLNFSIVEGGPFRWPAGPSFFDRTQTPGGVLLDIGVHVLDLLGWWLGEPANVRYADDAMGGLETNAFVQLEYANGARGRVHLSRDWATAQKYQFVFERGVVTWKVNDANGLTVQLAGAPAALQGSLLAPLRDAPLLAESRLLETNAQCFIRQLMNVVAAIAGDEPLLVPGEEGQHSLRLIEHCYAHRTLVEQPWLTPEESSRAQEFSAALPAAT
ncbi:MAG TPA: Gfo/Idh/MocA family oxidoreductase [Opitutus sp.]|nr:Gfo/Idh/MocA family oxidoreductase [Opitutus sp.]